MAALGKLKPLIPENEMLNQIVYAIYPHLFGMMFGLT